MNNLVFTLVLALLFSSCKKETVPSDHAVIVDSVFVNNVFAANSKSLKDIDYKNVIIDIHLSGTADTNLLDKSKVFILGSSNISCNYSFDKKTKRLFLTSSSQLQPLSSYRFTFDQGHNLGGLFHDVYTFTFRTRIDTTPKFPSITDDSLLTLVQLKTFGYFWNHGHPVSGLARERYGSGETVTAGGSGFGLMSILTGIRRGFITRQEGYERLNKAVTFLSNPSTDRFHGAFPHWLNGTTGKVIPFSSKDDGGDLVETAYLMQGLLTVREYFKSGTADEKIMCDSITSLWKEVDWSWFRKNDSNILYWHWSPDNGWAMNMGISGWNEALIVYVLAASSPTHPIPPEVYTNGWANNGAIRNNKTFYGIKLPLGEDLGGPMFFAHYSFLGLDPRNLSDQYASYWEQNVAHAEINHAYCKANPRNYPGYSDSCWGLTASDVQDGYDASSPNNDIGVIAPTAALASFPYTPVESMKALRFFYYTIGDKLFGDYGFHDAFNLSSGWFADSYLAIDQGPIACMIENYRTGFLWNLFMSNPEVKNGLTNLGFTY